ncbi:hypothetical protein M378DRAFT_582393 [Amanita muscaria Koide BX008]|uniref:Uncharacterized protein n=1 Tax=Amanita muscaria (strain Koide BX008) TaxID=946122 RepID=A0A0C2WSH7_AMAMK|nr:hypothetical protein M378DRAFT_582393 [Amanita muscaria Koide BX008]
MSKYAPHQRSCDHFNGVPKMSQTRLETCSESLTRSSRFIIGHFIFECKSERPYVTRPSRTQQLENPRLLAKLRAEGKPSVDVPEEFRKTGIANQILEGKEKERMKEAEDTAAKAKDETPQKRRKR